MWHFVSKVCIYPDVNMLGESSVLYIICTPPPTHTHTYEVNAQCVGGIRLSACFSPQTIWISTEFGVAPKSRDVRKKPQKRFKNAERLPWLSGSGSPSLCRESNRGRPARTLVTLLTEVPRLSTIVVVVFTVKRVYRIVALSSVCYRVQS
jgi:hypothetical protein